MGYIISAFLGIGLLIALVWGALFLKTWLQERAVRAKEAMELEHERLLQVPGELLFCVACQESITGPLPHEGCPHCHCTAFVVPDRLRQRVQEARNSDTVRWRQRG